jgi:hypothetical protein
MPHAVIKVSSVFESLGLDVDNLRYDPRPTLFRQREWINGVVEYEDTEIEGLFVHTVPSTTRRGLRYTIIKNPVEGQSPSFLCGCLNFRRDNILCKHIMSFYTQQREP